MTPVSPSSIYQGPISTFSILRFNLGSVPSSLPLTRTSPKQAQVAPGKTPTSTSPRFRVSCRAVVIPRLPLRVTTYSVAAAPRFWVYQQNTARLILPPTYCLLCYIAPVDPAEQPFAVRRHYSAASPRSLSFALATHELTFKDAQDPMVRGTAYSSRFRERGSTVRTAWSQQPATTPAGGSCAS